ncbi:hypothetical protein RRG08_026587 [Elysia crispata]|uniref:Nose resistant-to-fluoxetine protein N-terminal domain-containing protein n=1 Tax=Elysia crispata TaxID=231223 RepID=A0AAE0Y5I6_9GAST|nr:hypothetical protein RRG08_026587 [Elysia crispata]
MKTYSSGDQSIRKTLPKLRFLLLVQAICIAESCQTTRDDVGQLSWSCPEVRSPPYLDRLELAGRALAQNENLSHRFQTVADEGQLAIFFRAIESFLSLSPRHNSHSISNGLNSNDNAIQRDVVLRSALASMEGVAESGAVSSRCINDTGYLLVSMFQRQGWALKFLDAAGKPGPGLSEFRVNFVGDYDLCRSLLSNGTETFRGDYVTWKIAVGPIIEDNPSATPMIEWGVCMPDGCTEEEITLFASEAVQNLGLNGTMNVLKAESHTKHTQVTAATFASIVILCVVGTLMFAATLYDIVFLQWPRWEEQWKAREEERLMNSGMSGSEEDLPTLLSRPNHDEPLILNQSIKGPFPSPKGKLVKALLAFSVYTNGSKVLNTSQQPGSISCVHGIRFFSMAWVILGHIFAFCIGYIDNLVTVFSAFLSHATFDAVANALSSVDTFFTLSGLLVAYVSVTEMKRKRGQLNWGLFYFHRFWRLTPPYMLAMVLVLGLQQYCGQGPLWESLQPSDKVYCEKYWWTNLLYVNNLVHLDEPCFPHTWYLANDMQFYVISPLMIIPFYFNSFLGLGSCAIFFATHVITTGVLSAQHNWSPTLIAAANGKNFHSYFSGYYTTPWCRIGPYIVGIVTGYLLATKKNNIKLNWPIATIGWICAIAVALSVVYGLRGDISGDHPSSVLTAALYNALARSAWGICVAWVIVACVTGWGGFVNTFLSWSPFVVLSKLTYMAYLVHIYLINIYYGNQQTLVHMTSFNFAIIYMSILVATYAVSFVLMLALESPMIGLEKVFLPQR